MIRYRCWQCGQKIRAKQEFVGRTARCPSCGLLDKVPAAPSPDAPPAARKGQAPDEERESIIEEPHHHEEPEHDSIFESPPAEKPAHVEQRISYRCPHCNLKLRAPESAAGKAG